MSRGWILRLIDSRWFALAEFAIVASALALWIVQALEPRQVQFGGWPLLLALVPWGIRLAAGRFPFQRTSLELPIFIFMLAAAIGVWTAHDRDFAWVKFWLIIGGILIFYALVRQPRANQWLLAGFFGLLGVAIAAFFLLSHDWETEPAKVEAINEVGLWWMSVRPSSQRQGINPNAAASVAAMMMPFLLAVGVRSWQKRSIFLVALAFAGSVLLLIGLILTTSRGAWLALGSTTAIWALWILCGYLADRARWSRGRLFSIVLTILAGVGVILALTYPGGVLALIDSLPGPARAESRLELARETLDLISDFPITGGGLGSFPGLYSQYIFSSDAFALEHGHNMYLDTFLEVGPVGFLAFISLLVSSIWLLMKRLRQRNELAMTGSVLLEASLAALIVMSIHGLVDYQHEGAPFLFLLVGMAIGLSQDGLSPGPKSGQFATEAGSHQHRSESRMRRYVPVALVLAPLIAISLVVGKPLLAAWHANLGALQMARVELANWPRDVSSRMTDIVGPEFNEGSFRTALELDPTNRTAHHRLGIIDLQRQDFKNAMYHLERAFLLDSDYRGLWIPLGYGYVWSRNHDQVDLLGGQLSVRDLNESNAVFQSWVETEGDPRASLWLAYELIDAGDAEFATELIERDTIGGSALAQSIVNVAQMEDSDFTEKIQAMLEAVDTIALSDSAAAAAERGRLDHALLAYHALANVISEAGVLELANFLIYGPKDGDAAEAVLRQAVVTYPRSRHRLGWLLSLADLLRDEGKWDEAEAFLLQALEVHPNDPRVYIALGRTINDRGDGLEPTIAAFQRAIELDLDSGEGFYAVGETLAKAELHSEAAAWFDEALRIEPDRQWWRLARAENALDMGDLKQALAYFLDTVERHPDFAYAHHQLSWVYRLDNKPEEAIASIERAMSLSPASEEWILLRAATIHEWAGEFEKAANLYGYVLDIDSQNEAALEGIDRVEELMK